MIRILKTLILQFVFVFAICGIDACKTKSGHNKYREAKVRPSEKQMRADKKVIARGNRDYKKNLLSNRKHLFGNKRDPQAPRK